MKRTDGREHAEPRVCNIVTGFMETADGSCLISTGKTRVICTASIEEGVPTFLRGEGRGWITAEYAMLPASTGRRKARDGVRKDGRSVEIQRLIGRSLRQAVDMKLLGERTITLDCDVLQADGGTRTAAITGAWVALALAIQKLMNNGLLQKSPLVGQVAAISVGIAGNDVLLDLCYQEDSAAQADMNVVMNQQGGFIEVQGTGEERPFSNMELQTLLAYARKGIRLLMRSQRESLYAANVHLLPPMRLVIASDNEHKLKELSVMLGGAWELVSMRQAGYCEEIEENGETFVQNAKMKAEAVMKQTGLPTLADDSGLMVDALEGAPGVFSARYAGAHGNDERNNALLINNMQGRTNRRCKFVCAMALAQPGQETRIVQGECEGELLEELRGEGGFGYDPLFQYKNGKTFAQMSQKEKNKISHRARAMEEMKKILIEEC